EPELGGSELQIADFQFVSGGKREEGVDFISAENGHRENYLITRFFRKNEGIPDYDRAKEEVIEQVIHVIAPSCQPCVSILPNLTVVVISHVLQANKKRHHPEPSQIVPGNVGKHQDHRRPNKSQQSQVVRFQPGWNARQDDWRETSLEWG